MDTAETTSLDLHEPLTDALVAVERIRSEFNLESLAPQIRSLATIAREHGLVNVAVVGRFKAGKSSLLNQLIGAAVLPVDVLPATAVITQIAYGPRERAQVRFLDGRVEEIPLSRLAEFVTERENPENAKQVAVVDIALPSLLPFRSVRFVDTPGLGSVFVQGTKISMDWLPEIGAAIAAFSFDPPLSEEDVNLLRELTRFTPEIIIALTKVDMAAPGQAEAVEAFMHREIQKRVGYDFPIFPYSIDPKFQTLQHALRQHLAERLVGSHDERVQEIAEHKLHRLIEECREYLQLALAAAEASDNARAELLSLVQDEERAMTHVRAQLRVLGADINKRLHEALVEGYESVRPAILERVRADFDVQSRTWKGNLAKTSRAFQDWAEAALSRELGKVVPRGAEFAAAYVAEAEAQLGRLVRAFQDRLSAVIERALGTHFTGATFAVTIEAPCSPDIRIDKTFDIPLDMIWFLVPMFIFRPLVYGRLKSQLPWEVEKNLTRLAWQWTEAARASIASASTQAEQFMSQEISVVAGLAAGSENQVERAQAALAKLDRLEMEAGGLVRD